MRGRGVIAGLVAVLGAVALSGPAHADQYDFISQLDSARVSYKSMIDMIDIGGELCHHLRSAVMPPAMLGKPQRTGFAPVGSAIIPDVGCEQHVPGRQDGGCLPGTGQRVSRLGIRGASHHVILMDPGSGFRRHRVAVQGAVVARAAGGPPHLPAVSRRQP